MPVSISASTFIKRASAIHGKISCHEYGEATVAQKYHYDAVIYKNNHTPVEIICRNHGIFKQMPQHHINGHGCPKCASLTKAMRGMPRKQLSVSGKKGWGNLHTF